MPRTCPVSNKTYKRFKKRSHSMQSSIVRKQPNFVIKRIGNKRVKVAASALRTLKKKGLSLEKVLLD
jgi:ribosomal protein L28